MKPKLSIIILNYNTKDLLNDCLSSLEKVKDELSFEVIVCDNGSIDDSVQMIKQRFPKVIIIENGANVGFAKGNNAAKSIARGEYILFLNSDTIVHKNALKETVSYMDDHHEVGALTCKLVLPDGSLDKDARRSFITPWIGLTHLFLRLDRLFPQSKLFGKYWYGYMSPDETHEVDVIQGAFFLTRKEIMDQVGWFDEDYFLDAEDIDLSWKVKKAGWKNVYYPKVNILHIKGATKGNNSKTKKKVPIHEKLKYRLAGVNSMEIFVKKRLWKEYPLPVMIVVLFGIKVLKAIRFMKVVILG